MRMRVKSALPKRASSTPADPLAGALNRIADAIQAVAAAQQASTHEQQRMRRSAMKLMQRMVKSYLGPESQSGSLAPVVQLVPKPDECLFCPHPLAAHTEKNLCPGPMPPPAG